MFVLSIILKIDVFSRGGWSHHQSSRLRHRRLYWCYRCLQSSSQINTNSIWIKKNHRNSFHVHRIQRQTKLQIYLRLDSLLFPNQSQMANGWIWPILIVGHAPHLTYQRKNKTQRPNICQSKISIKRYNKNPPRDSDGECRLSNL